MATASIPPPSEADILQRTTWPEPHSLAAEVAQALLGIDFDPRDRDRRRVLSRKAQEGRLTRAEEAEIERYERVGHLIDIMHSRARRLLEPVREPRIWPGKQEETGLLAQALRRLAPRHAINATNPLRPALNLVRRHRLYAGAMNTLTSAETAASGFLPAVTPAPPRGAVPRPMPNPRPPSAPVAAVR